MPGLDSEEWPEPPSWPGPQAPSAAASQRRQQARWAEQEPALGAAARPGPRPRRAARRPRSTKLKELGELHQSGVLTDEEFAAQKAKLLG